VQKYSFCPKKTSFSSYFFSRLASYLVTATTGSFAGNHDKYQQKKAEKVENIFFHKNQLWNTPLKLQKSHFIFQNCRIFSTKPYF